MNHMVVCVILSREKPQCVLGQIMAILNTFKREKSQPSRKVKLHTCGCW